MRLLDLFCGAGGCSVGYARAGFDVVGVDIEPHDDYPYELHVMDWGESAPMWPDFDVIHASPPCQHYTTMSNRRRGDWADLLEPVRAALRDWGGTYVIENVPGARRRMAAPVILRGADFDLGVDRPRLFESNALLWPSPGRGHPDPVGVYGKLDGRRLFTRSNGTEQRAARGIPEAQAAMGIDWMRDPRDLAEAIPPAYTEHIGWQLLAHLGDTPNQSGPPTQPGGGPLLCATLSNETVIRVHR